MTAILKVDEIQDTNGNLIIKEDSNTITVGASGDTTNIVGTLQNNGSALISGITEADQWKLTSDLELTTTTITANLSRVNKIGTGMTESSGVFTFPSTGLYMIRAEGKFVSTSGSGSSRYIYLRTVTTTNNSTYNNVARAGTSIYNFQNNTIHTDCSSTLFFDVTNTSTHKVKFTAESATPSGYYLKGTSSDIYTNFSFIRLGDT